MKKKDLSIQFVTLGGSPGSALGGVKKIFTERVVLFTSANMLDIGKEVKEIIEDTFKIRSEIIEVDAFNIMECITMIVQKASSEIQEARNMGITIQLSMNMTGGTNIMASSMLLSAYIIASFAGERETIRKVRLYYLKSERLVEVSDRNWAQNNELIEVPLPRISMKELTKEHQDIMIAVSRSKKISFDHLRVQLRYKSISALNRYTDLLERKELIIIYCSEEQKTLELTDSGRLLVSLFAFREDLDSS